MSCLCLACSITYTPSADAATTRERLTSFYAAEQNAATANARVESATADIARHEAGHCVMGAVFGRKVRYATIGGGFPHVSYANEDSISLFVSIACSLAGNAAASITRGDVWALSWPFMTKYIRWARSGETGACDFCATARELVEGFADRPDQELIATWSGFNRIVASIFTDDEVIGAILSIASLLRERTLLESDEIERILSRYDLVGAPDRALAGVDLKLLLPVW